MKLLNHEWVKYAQLVQMKNELARKKSQISAALEFVKAITAGDLDTSIKITGDNGTENELSASLTIMRDHMKKIAIEEGQRNWDTQGMAKFGEIFRQKNNTLKELSETIIASLIKYLNANQGALYIVNENNANDIFIELAACYAYGRKKFIEQRIEMGDGLTGQVALEKSTLYMTSIPEGYLKITSGLGEALPRNLLIVPLKLEDKVLGLVEIASFEMIQPHQIEFVERLGKSIASTIASVRVNERTQQLLHETQTQAEQMRAQEEEMRQNMEELTATQEEMHRILKEVQSQERYMNELIDSSSDSILVIDRSYKVVSANKTLRQTYANLGIEVVKGLEVSKLFEQTDWLKYKSFYDRTFAGETFQRTELFESHGFKLYFMSQHTPLRDPEGNVVASAVFAKDVTELVAAQKTAEELASDQQQKNEELKAQEEELRQNMEELAATQDEMQKIILEVQKKEKYLDGIINVSNDIIFTVDMEYKVISFNKTMEDAMVRLGLPFQKGFCLLDIFQGSDRDIQKAYYDRSLAGESHQRTDHFANHGVDVYSMVSYAPLRNENDEIYAVAVYSKDVTELHLTLDESRKKQQELDAIINASTDPIWTVDINYKLMTFNTNFVNVFAARNVTVAKGMDMIEVLQENERKPQIEIYARVFAGQSFDLTQTFTYQNEETHILISYSPMKNEKGEITGATVYAKNITGMVNAQQRAERLAKETQMHNEVLKQSQADLENVAQKIHALERRDLAYASSTLFMEIDSMGKVLDLNNKLNDLTEYQREELVDKSYHHIIDMPKRLFLACCRSLHASRSWNGIVRGVTRTGTHYWIDVTMIAETSEGKIVRILATGYPISHPVLGAVLYNEQAKQLGCPIFMTPENSTGQKKTGKSNGVHRKLPVGNKAA